MEQTPTDRSLQDAVAARMRALMAEQTAAITRAIEDGRALRAESARAAVLRAAKKARLTRAGEMAIAIAVADALIEAIWPSPDTPSPPDLPPS